MGLVVAVVCAWWGLVWFLGDELGRWGVGAGWGCGWAKRWMVVFARGILWVDGSKGAVLCRPCVPLLVGRPAAAARASSSACKRAAYAASSSTLELECPPTPPE